MKRILPLATTLLLASVPALAERPAFLVDCSRGESLPHAAAFAFPGVTLRLKGDCTGPVNLRTANVTLEAVASGASIHGAGKDALTINGVHGIVLKGLTITGGANGVVLENGAEATLDTDILTGNAAIGLLTQSHSTATLTGGSSSGNGFHGVDVESGSALLVSGPYTVSGNGVFGMDINNGSSLTLTAATLTATGNTLGVQIGTGSSAFEDQQSKFTASFNATVGLTLVSGSHMVDFGGAITAYDNGNNGISLNSKSGLDLDAAAQLTSYNNAADGLHLEQTSVMTVFNNPQFSGTPGTTMLNLFNNQGDGLNLLTASAVLIDNFAALQSANNAKAGVAADNGSALTFGQTIPVTGVHTTVALNNPDLQLTFGARLTTLPNDLFPTTSCDATSLTRGPVVCH